jgi:hypothetical protein
MAGHTQKIHSSTWGSVKRTRRWQAAVGTQRSLHGLRLWLTGCIQAHNAVCLACWYCWQAAVRHTTQSARPAVTADRLQSGTQRSLPGLLLLLTGTTLTFLWTRAGEMVKKVKPVYFTAFIAAENTVYDVDSKPFIALWCLGLVKFGGLVFCSWSGLWMQSLLFFLTQCLTYSISETVNYIEEIFFGCLCSSVASPSMVCS